MGKETEKLNSAKGIRIFIQSPAEGESFSRAFYQAEEETLIVSLFPEGKFFSYLDSPQLSFDIDSRGRLLSIQVLVERKSWRTRKNLKPPPAPESADIRFIDFRDQMPEARIESTSDGKLMHIVFIDDHGFKAYRLTDKLKVEVTSDSYLAGIWILDIEDDRAAQELAAWRKQMKGEE